MNGEKMNKEIKQAGLSYLRATLSCVAALYLSGVTDPKTLLNAAIAGLIGPIVKGLDKNDNNYGIKGE
jgi:hypothetical protein